MSHPAADRVIGLYQDGAEGWIADRGPSLYAGPNGPNEAEWLDRFVADLPSNARLLDVGCGSGTREGAYVGSALGLEVGSKLGDGVGASDGVST